MQSASAQHCMYEITAIVEAPPCGPGFPAFIEPEGFNNLGVVVGNFGGCTLGDSRPFIWSHETGFVELPLPPGITDAGPHDISDQGAIVGSMIIAGDDSRPFLKRAFLYKDGVWTNLGVLPGFEDSEALAINEKNEIVGVCQSPGRAAFIWRDGLMEAIELPLGPNSVATDINAIETIVGWMGEGGAGDSLGFISDEGTVTEIPPLHKGNRADAVAINNNGDVVGITRIPVKGAPIERRSWIWIQGDQLDLGVLAGFTSCVVEDMNEAMQVVGACTNPPPDNDNAPFLWQHGDMVDLRTLIMDVPRDLFPDRARVISDNGQIVITAASATKIVLLSPLERPLGDVNIDCNVDENDLLFVLRNWGEDRRGNNADIVTSVSFQPPGDGNVDGADLAVVLGNWGVSSSRSIIGQE